MCQLGTDVGVVWISLAGRWITGVDCGQRCGQSSSDRGQPRGWRGDVVHLCVDWHRWATGGLSPNEAGVDSPSPPCPAEIGRPYATFCDCPHIHRPYYHNGRSLSILKNDVNGEAGRETTDRSGTAVERPGGLWTSLPSRWTTDRLFGSTRPSTPAPRRMPGDGERRRPTTRHSSSREDTGVAGNDGDRTDTERVGRTDTARGTNAS